MIDIWRSTSEKQASQEIFSLKCCFINRFFYVFKRFWNAQKFSIRTSHDHFSSGPGLMSPRQQTPHSLRLAAQVFSLNAAGKLSENQLSQLIPQLVVMSDGLQHEPSRTFRPATPALSSEVTRASPWSFTLMAPSEEVLMVLMNPLIVCWKLKLCGFERPGPGTGAEDVRWNAGLWWRE